MLKKLDWRAKAFLGSVLFASLCAYLFLGNYFRSYYQPDRDLPVYLLESGWEYETERTPRRDLGELGGIGPREVGAGEALTLYRTLNTAVEDASLMIRSKHQNLWVLLDGELIYESIRLPADRDPGIGLHLVHLPGDYMGSELTLIYVSPYYAYSGRAGSVFMGSPADLEATLFAHALRPILFMAISLFLGFCTIGLAFAQGLQGIRQWKYLAIGAFAVDWGVYYLCNEGIVLNFFGPVQASVFSLGCYYFMQVPLSIFFHCSFVHLKKWMKPAVAVHCVFVAAAIGLQLFGVRDLPELVHINNALIAAGVFYMLVLCVAEVHRGNRYLWVSTPFLFVAWGFTVVDYGLFYLTRKPMQYLFLDLYFLLVLAVLSHSIWQFFRQYYEERREAEMLSLQSKAAMESYQMEREHNRRLRELKHDFYKHMGALQLYIGHEKYEEAFEYLQRISGDYADLNMVSHSDNLFVNAAVSRVLRVAKQEGIQVELGVEEVGELSIDNADLFSLLSNVLDNALEACMAVPAPQPRFLSFHIRRREPYLYVECKNSRYGKMLHSGDTYYSTKRNSEQHGYGLAIIRRIVEDNDGMMDISYNDFTFQIELAIKVAQHAELIAN